MFDDTVGIAQWIFLGMGLLAAIMAVWFAALQRS